MLGVLSLVSVVPTVLFEGLGCRPFNVGGFHLLWFMNVISDSDLCEWRSTRRVRALWGQAAARCLVNLLRCRRRTPLVLKVLPQSQACGLSPVWSSWWMRSSELVKKNSPQVKQ